MCIYLKQTDEGPQLRGYFSVPQGDVTLVMGIVVETLQILDSRLELLGMHEHVSVLLFTKSCLASRLHHHHHDPSPLGPPLPRALAHIMQQNFGVLQTKV
eukprot:5787920-Amphidinium_carterae.2